MKGGNLVRNYAIYVGLGFLSPALNFLLLPIYTKTLTKLDFSILAMSILIQGLFKNLIGGGINGAYARFYFEYKKSNEINSLFFTSVSTVTGSMFVWLLLMFFVGDFLLQLIFSNNEFTFIKYGWISLVLAAFMNIQQLILSKYRNEEDAISFAVIASTSFLLPAVLIYTGVVIFKGGALYSLLGRMIGVGSVILIYLAVFLIRNKVKYNKSFLKSMFKYSRDIMFYLLLTFFFQNVDKYLIENNFDFADFGMYGLAISVVSIVEIFVFAMNNATKPRIFKLLKLEQSPENDASVRNLNRVIMLSLSVIWFGLLLTFPFLNRYVLSNLYPELTYYFPIMLLVMIGRIYYIVYANPIFFYMHTNLMPYITVACLVFSVTGSLLLIPYFGILAIMMMSSLTSFFQLFLVIYFSKKKGILSPQIFSHPKEHKLYAYGLLLALTLHIAYANLHLETAYLVSIVSIVLTGGVYLLLYFREIIVAKRKILSYAAKYIR